jgi:DNA repair protein RadC
MAHNSALHSAGHRRRIKEKFKHQGLEAFHDYEVIELLLTYCIARKDVKPAAKNLLDRFSSIRDVFDAPLEELKQIEEIGLDCVNIRSINRQLLICTRPLKNMPLKSVRFC